MALGATALGATATILVLAAPSASANVTSVNISQGLSLGGSTAFGTGCTYRVTANVNGPGDVRFYDNGVFFAGPLTPTGGAATVQWTPTGTGKHIIQARQVGPPNEETRMVGNGLNLGSSCVVLPF
ncbi:hypothetical protein CJ179_46360 [Rhodococcus sp. ACS1]|nr:hypothetical protein CJ179_46360 [Rhodococcus sp. ACS1]